MSTEYHKVLAALRLMQSAGRTGICFDNAMAESFFGTLKNECVNRMAYSTREEARQHITRYIEFWYNRRRLHSAMGYRPPHEVYIEHKNQTVAV
jgi:putative transposase